MIFRKPVVGDVRILLLYVATTKKLLHTLGGWLKELIVAEHMAGPKTLEEIRCFDYI